MCARFEEWKTGIKDYCEKNGLSYEKAEAMVKSSNENTLLLQYYDPESGKNGLLDERPMPAVLWIYKGTDGLRFEQTEYTREYLAK